MSNTLTSKVSGRMSSRGWAIALGIGAVVLAAILLVVYLDRYRDRVAGENAPTPVLQCEPTHPRRHAGLAHRESGHVHVDDAAAEGSRRRSHRRPCVSQRPRGGRGHLPRLAAHRRGLRRERHGVRRLADHGHAAGHLDLGRRRARKLVADHARRLGRRVLGRRRHREALRAEREGPDDADGPRAGRWRQPDHPHRDRGRCEVGAGERHGVASGS